MKVLELFKKELRWSKHNAVVLVLVLVVLPAVFAASSVAFATAVPEDVPVAIAPANENVTEDDLTIVRGSVTLFSQPRSYDSPDAAKRALRREEVYAVIVVPPGLTDPGTASANITLSVEGAMVPFQRPSQIVAGAMEFTVNDAVPANVQVQRETVGRDKTLSEYLVPVFLLTVVALFALTYLPYNLARESAVVERVRVEASLDALVAAKIAHFTALMFVPVAAFAVTTSYLGFGVTVLSPGGVGVLLLTFLYLAALSTAVMLFTKLSTFGRFLNVVLLFGLTTFSNMVYPVGFFSTLRRDVARWMPLHHSMIIIRSEMLKETPLGLFTDRIALLAGFTLLTFVLAKAAIVHYERTV